jgi:hypothetical protein
MRSLPPYLTGWLGSILPGALREKPGKGLGTHFRPTEDDGKDKAPSPRPEPSVVASDPVENAPQEAVIPAVENEKPTEAVTMQVVGQPAANNAPGAVPASTQGPRPRLSAENHAAIQEQYRQEVAKTMRYFYECTGSGPPGPSDGD